MTSRKKTMKKEKKTKVYKCFHYDAEYDDLGKYYWCHNSSISCNECNAGRGYYCQQFCPGYKKGNYKGEWVISDWEKKEAEAYKVKLDKEAADHEVYERALYEHLKKKYG